MERDTRINQTAEIMADYFNNHPEMATIYYPKYIT
jgi:cystathionine beta-lyase/cystathionine gamma-synthase